MRWWAMGALALSACTGAASVTLDEARLSDASDGADGGAPESGYAGVTLDAGGASDAGRDAIASDADMLADATDEAALDAGVDALGDDAPFDAGVDACLSCPIAMNGTIPCGTMDDGCGHTITCTGPDACEVAGGCEAGQCPFPESVCGTMRPNVCGWFYDDCKSTYSAAFSVCVQFRGSLFITYCAEGHTYPTPYCSASMAPSAACDPNSDLRKWTCDPVP